MRRIRSRRSICCRTILENGDVLLVQGAGNVNQLSNRLRGDNEGQLSGMSALPPRSCRARVLAGVAACIRRVAVRDERSRCRSCGSAVNSALPERDAVKAAVLQRLNGGLLGISLDDVVEGVLALSWPREVSVRRVWPGIVDVNVTKDTFVARWGAGGVLNSGGQVVDSAGHAGRVAAADSLRERERRRAMQIFQMLGQVLGRHAAEGCRSRRGCAGRVARHVHQRADGVARPRRAVGTRGAVLARVSEGDQRPSRRKSITSMRDIGMGWR